MTKSLISQFITLLILLYQQKKFYPLQLTFKYQYHSIMYYHYIIYICSTTIANTNITLSASVTTTAAAVTTTAAAVTTTATAAAEQSTPVYFNHKRPHLLYQC